MNPLTYVRATDAAAAVTAIAANTRATVRADSDVPLKLLAGGTNLVDLLKLGIMRPQALVDIGRLPLATIADNATGGVRVGALARNADTAYHPLIARRYPLLRAAILAGASPQIRNAASNGGNLLQRTRCAYFYDRATPCNKREPGSGCSAIGGLTKYHAILGASPHCIATHPSDMCVALAALGATVHVASVRGVRDIAFADLHRLPGDRPERDSTLAADELIVHLDLPDADRFAPHSAYLKIRERLSYAFALVSVAAALDLDAQGTVREARIALGGVAHKPWRRPEAEALLVGQPATPQAFAAAAEALLSGARAQGGNAFKITLAQRTVVRALETAMAGTHDNSGTAHATGGERR